MRFVRLGNLASIALIEKMSLKFVIASGGGLVSSPCPGGYKGCASRYHDHDAESRFAVARNRDPGVGDLHQR